MGDVSGGPIDAFPLDRNRRAQLRETFMTAGAAAPRRTRSGREEPEAAPASPASKDTAKAQAPRRTPPSSRGPGRPAAASYEVFGGRYTLSELSKRPECLVSYPTLRSRLTDPDNLDRQWTAQEVEEAATRPANPGAAAYRRKRAVMAGHGSSGSAAAITVASAHGRGGQVADCLRCALGFIAYTGSRGVGHLDDRPKEGQ
ncbi:hypothetical protein AB0N79_37065 [Streptomyces microflavus]|uniref:hypothetical protein n=1 Tax=Streptomyces microflavus TaxID=1919 RepID=UPI00343ACE5E